MRSSSLAVAVAVVAACPVLGAAAYRATTAPEVVRAQRLTQAVAETAPAAVVRLRPCQPPARLRDGVCVTHRVRTVLAAQPAAPASAAPGSRPGRDLTQPDAGVSGPPETEPTRAPDDEGDEDGEVDEAGAVDGADEDEDHAEGHDDGDRPGYDDTDDDGAHPGEPAGDDE